MKKKELKILIPEVPDLNATVSSSPVNSLSQLIESKYCSYYLTPSSAKYNTDDNFYNFPFLLNHDGSPWRDGIRFVNHLIELSDTSDGYLNDTQKRKISHIQDFKIWCEKTRIDMFDFTARRAERRPTYSYFSHLLGQGISGHNINHRTSIIYKWFVFFKSLYSIDLARVDQVYNTFRQFKNTQGQSFSKAIESRKLTAKVTKTFNPKLGHIYDDGEELRPLDNDQTDELYKALEVGNFKMDEKLIFEFSLDTGARKQTVLTLRLKHIDSFKEENLHPDGCYKLQAGANTDIDTKFDKRLVISVPAHLAEKLKMYAYCQEAKDKREKFIERFGKNVFKEEKDMYLFLGERGDCRYMAKSDPRYKKKATRSNGRSISNIVKRLRKVLPSTFPQGYVFHWNRATFAYHSYQMLSPLLKSKDITFEMLVGFIQSSLGHQDPEVTLNYLKLFNKENILFKIQAVWESKFFNRSSLKESKARLSIK